MTSKVVIFDTSVLCCWLKVPGKDTCGPAEDHWTAERIEQLVEKELKKRSTFVLPLASIIETGNHIAQSSGDKFPIAKALTELIEKSLQQEEPWAAFAHQSELWNDDNLARIADVWPELAKQGLGMGDVTIKAVAEFYAKSSHTVEILTGDQGLKSYTPIAVMNIPRRRKLKQ